MASRDVAAWGRQGVSGPPASSLESEVGMRIHACHRGSSVVKGKGHLGLTQSLFSCPYLGRDSLLYSFRGRGAYPVCCAAVRVVVVSGLFNLALSFTVRLETLLSSRT